MKLSGLVTAGIVVLSAVAAGCSRKEAEAPDVKVVARPAPAPAPVQEPPPGRPAQPPAERPVGESVLRGPTDYLYTVTITAPRHARASIDVSQVQHDIETFKAMEGHSPASLDELVKWRGAPLPDVPKGYHYEYDPATAKVAVVPTE
jgi:hypothetical protein